jgi:processive 1,2-diacylglycerol beta-glucosyltransferase
MLPEYDGSITIGRYQALEESSGLYRFGVQAYNWIQKTCPALHHIYFNFLEVFQVSASQHTLLGKDKYKERLQKTQPNVIVSVHAHTNHAFRALAKKVLPNVRFVTYCGEMHGGYGFSKHWVDPKADAFIGATPEICQAAQQLGMPDDRIHYGGLLLDPNFYNNPLSASERTSLLREVYQFDPEKFTLLLSTGANGALNHPRFLKALEQARLPIQVIALCGRNESARTQIDKLSSNFSSITVRTLGYQEDMFPLMQCADAVVARPGTGTTSEAIMAGCPILFNTLSGIMPQEWITIKYMRSRGFTGPRLRNPEDLIQQISPWVQDPNKRLDLKEQMKRLRPNSTPKDILNMLQTQNG